MDSFNTGYTLAAPFTTRPGRDALSLFLTDIDYKGVILSDQDINKARLFDSIPDLVWFLRRQHQAEPHRSQNWTIIRVHERQVTDVKRTFYTV